MDDSALEPPVQAAPQQATREGLYERVWREPIVAALPIHGRTFGVWLSRVSNPVQRIEPTGPGNRSRDHAPGGRVQYSIVTSRLPV